MRWSLLNMKFENLGKPSIRRTSITSSGIAVKSPIIRLFHDTGLDAFSTSRGGKIKESTGAKTLVYPTSSFVVGTYDKNGKPNVIC